MAIAAAVDVSTWRTTPSTTVDDVKPETYTKPPLILTYFPTSPERQPAAARVSVMAAPTGPTADAVHDVCGDPVIVQSPDAMLVAANALLISHVTLLTSA